MEDPDRQAASWVEAFQRITEELPEPAGAYLSNIRYTESMDLPDSTQDQQPHPQQRKIRKADTKLGAGDAASAF